MRTLFPSRAGTHRHRLAAGDFASRTETLLLSLGADPLLLEAVLGDLAEECATRSARDGMRAARWWYVREALRSTPHLLASAIRGASWRRRGAFATGAATIAFAITLAASGLLGGVRRPARLVAIGDMGDGVVVNNVKPVRLVMRVLDSSGRTLPDTGVRFRWTSGARIAVSARGVTTCSQPGDALVQASLGTLAAQLILRCRPVRAVRFLRTMHLVVGDPAEELSFAAFDSLGKPVSLLRGEINVEDTSVVAIDVAADGRHLVRGRSPGSSVLDLHVGDRSASTGVHVYARAASLEGIRPGQHRAIPVDLAAGELRSWQLPAAREAYYVTMLPHGDAQHVPRVAIVGANCVLDARSFFCVALHGASVFVYRPREGDQGHTATGTLAVWRREQP